MDPYSKNILGAMFGFLPRSTETEHVLHEPYLTALDENSVAEAVRSGYVSSIGSMVEMFEELICEYTGAKYAIATNSGTAALQAALIVSGLKSNEEVFVPAISFVATANAVSYIGAIPHFVDCSKDTLAIDEHLMEKHIEENCEFRDTGLFNKRTGKRIHCIIVMHCFGHPAKMNSINRLAKKYRLKVIEDAAEALGSFLEAKHMGTFSHMGVFSFNGNKIITSGGGGVVVTNHSQYAKRLRHITTTAKKPHKWEYFHDEVGFNFRLPNVNAALGCSQMKQLNEILDKKKVLSQRYSAAFADNEFFEIVEQPSGASSNYWLNSVRLKTPSKSIRNKVLKSLNDHGFGSRPLWSPLPTLPMYNQNPRSDIKSAISLYNSIICLPSSAKLADF